MKRQIAALVTLALALGSGGVSQVHADGDLKNLDIRSYHEWCSTAGSCAALSGTADYHYAEADASTFTDLRAGKTVGAPEEIYAACSHAYTDASGVRHLDNAWVEAHDFAAGTPSQGVIAATVGVPTLNADQHNRYAMGFIQGSISRVDTFHAFNSGTGDVAYQASNKALISGTQYTDNNSSIIRSGGFHITITGTIRHYHRAIDSTYGFAYWHFDGTSQDMLTCSTVKSAGEVATLQYNGDSIYTMPD
jgi:hypothetical protein